MVAYALLIPPAGCHADGGFNEYQELGVNGTIADDKAPTAVLRDFESISAFLQSAATQFPPHFRESPKLTMERP